MLNEVFVVGTIQTDLKEVPSKSESLTYSFRVKVPRLNGGSDSIICVLDDSELIDLFCSLNLNDEISIAGKLQSRFFRSGNRGASVTEVKVEDLIQII